MDARLAALRLLAGVEAEGLTLAEQMEDALFEALAPSERARAQSIATGVLRRRDVLDAVIDPHLKKKPLLRARMVLRIAAWEMLVDGISPHAAVDSAVNAAKASKKTAHLGGLVNAVARKLEGSSLGAQAQRFPKYLRNPFVTAYGEDATAAIEQVCSEVPPIDLTLKVPGEAEAWAEKLGADLLPTGSLRLPKRVQVSALEGFETGDWWVQDVAAAMPVHGLGDIKGARVLDLCAAPGGKTMQLASAGAQVTALDVAAGRMERVAENLKRTGLSADCVTADALTWEPEDKFDVIVLDAPCSATGTIRRHPDLPIVRARADLQPVFALQRALLERALGWLRPQGRLLYITCSLLPAEGERQIEKLSAVNLAGLNAPAECLTPEGYLRTRPDIWADRGGMDGFFASLLTQ